MTGEIDNTIHCRIATYLLPHKRAIVSVEAYAPRQDRWFVLHSGFQSREEAHRWIEVSINTSHPLEVTEIEITVKEIPTNG